MVDIWADYSGGQPGGTALKTAGFTGAIRYVGIGYGGKRLTVAERDDLLGAGLQVLGVVESTATEANAGWAAGVADGQAALNDEAAAGLPYLLFTNDQPTYSQADVDYARGFASVVGAARTGGYGFHDYLTACGPLAVRWQCGEPPNLTGTQGQTHLWQRQGNPGDGSDGPATPTTITVGGVQCDINNQLLPLPGGDVPLTQADADLIVTTLINRQIPNPITNTPETLGAAIVYDEQRITNQIKALLTPLTAQLTAIQGALTTDEAALLAAIKGVTAGAVDVTALAGALVPLLSAADAQALMTALKTQLTK